MDPPPTFGQCPNQSRFFFRDSFPYIGITSIKKCHRTKPFCSVTVFVRDTSSTIKMLCLFLLFISLLWAKLGMVTNVHINKLCLKLKYQIHFSIKSKVGDGCLRVWFESKQHKIAYDRYFEWSNHTRKEITLL